MAWIIHSKLYSREMGTFVQQKVSTRICTIDMFSVTKTEHNRMESLCYSHSTIYYIEIRMNNLQLHGTTCIKSNKHNVT